MAFPRQHVLARQKSEKVAYKPGLDYLLKCFLPSTFSESSTLFPIEKCQKFLELGGLWSHRPLSPYASGFSYDFSALEIHELLNCKFVQKMSCAFDFTN